MRSFCGFPPKSTMIPNMIKPIKAITLMLENQNSSSPNTLIPRKFTRKTGVEESVKAEDGQGLLTQEDKDNHPNPYRNAFGPVVDNNACPTHFSSYDIKTPATTSKARLIGYHALTCCIDVIRSNDEVFHEVVPPQRETHAARVLRSGICI